MSIIVVMIFLPIRVTLLIIYIGSIMFNTPNSSFALNNILSVPHITRNVLSVSQFYKTNDTSIEFFSSHFVVKDLTTWVILICN